jgi:hypothetical protein
MYVFESRISIVKFAPEGTGYRIKTELNKEKKYQLYMMAIIYLWNITVKETLRKCLRIIIKCMIK